MIAAREQARRVAAAAERLGLGDERLRRVWAPYRVCLLGAHVDHQLGRVAALAIDRGTLLGFAASDTAEVSLASLDYPGSVRFRVDAIPPRRQGDWGDYARGAALVLARSGARLSRGLVGVVSGAGSEGGLASSASVGLAYLLALAAANGIVLSAAELVRLDQAIENGYFGLANGILDPAAIAFSKRDQLTTVDCRAFAAAAPPASAPGIALLPRPQALAPFVILVAGSGVSQAIVATDYNRRVAECREAARTLLTRAGRLDAEPLLGNVSAEEYEAHRSALAGAAARRARHFFSEQARVATGEDAWRDGELARLGQLVTASGESSIANYECGSPPLVDLFQILVRTEGIYGARFSGAGFRGCCIALARPEAVAAAEATVLAAYRERQPALAARAFVQACASDDGARFLCKP
jgi:galacturonokinase